MRLSHVLIAAAAAACVSALLVLTFERPGDVQKSDKAAATVGAALSERWPSRDLAAMTPKQAADSRKIADRIAPLVKAEPAPASVAIQEPAKSAPLAEASGERVTETKAAPEVAPAPPSALRIRAARARTTENAANEETVVKSKAASNGAAKNRFARKTVVKNSAKSATANSAKSSVAKSSVAKSRSKAFARARTASPKTASKPGYYYEVSGGQGYAEQRVRRACVPGLRMPQVCYYPQNTRRHFPVRADE
jgi:hypothetical protein